MILHDIASADSIAALLCLGHPYMILLVMLCQMLVYKEVTALFELRDGQHLTSKDESSADPFC